MKRFSLLKSDFIRWLKSDKQILLALCYICFSMYVIVPMRDFASVFDEPLNIFEAYLTFLGNGFSMIIIIIVFMFLIIDFPDLSANSIFILSRTGRKRWLNNQLAFVYLAAATYMLLIFLFSIVTTADISFAANGWSNVLYEINMTENTDMKIQNALAVLDTSIFNNFRPYEALLYNSILMFLQITFFGQLQICLTVRFNKIIAIFVNMLFIVAGVILWNAGSWLKWFFTISNSTVGWHNDGFFSKSFYPLWASFAYMIGLNLIIYISSNRFVKNRSFMLGTQ